jgi:hypothetical protein
MIVVAIRNKVEAKNFIPKDGRLWGDGASGATGYQIKVAGFLLE